MLVQNHRTACFIFDQIWAETFSKIQMANAWRRVDTWVAHNCSCTVKKCERYSPLRQSDDWL